MANTTRFLASAAVLTVTLLGVRAAVAAQIDQRTIGVHVVDFGKTGAAELARAEEEASRIYAAVGIHVVWLTGDEETETADAPTVDLTVVVLSHQGAAQMIEADRIGDGVLGHSAKAAGRAYIFYSRVAEAAGRFGRTRAEVLGRVIAHEVGHVLLPVYSHSKTGLMCANLDLRAKELKFTEEEGAAMRRMLTAQR